jgi:predicted DNA-binding transcriptional regulator YafY
MSREDQQNETPQTKINVPQKKSDADRRLRQADRLARVLRVLQLIQSRGRWTRQAIAEELECSKRTVERYLDVLEFAGVPYYTEKPGNYVRVRPDYRFPVLNLTDNELIGQSTATALTQAPNLDVNAGAKPTSEKISASNPKSELLLTEAAQLTRVLDLKLADHSQHHETIRTVQWALLERKQLTGHYRSPYEPTPVKLTLHPYRLCLVKAAWYLIGRPIDAILV